MRQPSKQLTLQIHSPEFPEAVVRSKEEGELFAYIENTGKQPNNLDPFHPAYKLWTYKNARSGNVLELISEYESKR